VGLTRTRGASPAGALRRTPGRLPRVALHRTPTRRGRRVAELRPVRPERLPLTKGEGKNPGYSMAPDFDEPLEDMTEYS